MTTAVKAPLAIDVPAPPSTSPRTSCQKRFIHSCAVCVFPWGIRSTAACDTCKAYSAVMLSAEWWRRLLFLLLSYFAHPSLLLHNSVISVSLTSFSAGTTSCFTPRQVAKWWWLLLNLCSPLTSEWTIVCPLNRKEWIKDLYGQRLTDQLLVFDSQRILCWSITKNHLHQWLRSWSSWPRRTPTPTVLYR